MRGWKYSAPVSRAPCEQTVHTGGKEEECLNAGESKDRVDLTLLVGGEELERDRKSVHLLQNGESIRETSVPCKP